MPKAALLLVVVVFAALALGQTATASQQATSDKDAAQLKEIEQKWFDAMSHGDITYLEGITAPDFTYTGPTGEIMSRTQLTDSIKTSKLKVESGNVGDLNVRFYGSAAVVTGTYTQKGTQDGKPFTETGRFTDTFIKQDGKWLAVATHASNKSS